MRDKLVSTSHKEDDVFGLSPSEITREIRALQPHYNEWRDSGRSHEEYVEGNGLDDEVGQALQEEYEKTPRLCA